MIDGITVTIAWALNKVIIIAATLILVIAVLTLDVYLWMSVALCILVLIRALAEWKIANDYIMRYGGDSTWRDDQAEK